MTLIIDLVPVDIECLLCSSQSIILNGTQSVGKGLINQIQRLLHRSDHLEKIAFLFSFLTLVWLQ